MLTLDGSTDVPIAANAITEEVVEIGERGRAFDGTVRSTIRARKYVWTLTTPPQTRAVADTLKTFLTASTTRTATGDLVGSSTPVHIEYLGRTISPGPQGAQSVRTQFRMYER